VADILAKHLSGGGGGGAPLKKSAAARRGAVRPVQSASPDHHGSWSPHGSLSLQTG